MKVMRLLHITVCMAVALAAWQVFIYPLSAMFQWVFFAVLVFIIGVPHGALDLYVQQRSDQLSGKQSRTVLFLANYCSYILLYAVAWYLFPAMAFVLFLIISCLHFGETDLTYFFPAAAIQKVIAFIYGAALLLILLLPQSIEVSIILQQLLPAYKSLPGYLQFMQENRLVTIGFSIVVIASIVISQMYHHPEATMLQAPLLLAVLLGCCSLMPLLPAFALYFVGWHSIISLHQIGLYIESGNTQPGNQSFVLPLLTKGIPFSLLAMTGLAIAVLLFRYFSISFQPLPLVLMFLSVITLPHLRVMNELNQRLPFSR